MMFLWAAHDKIEYAPIYERPAVKTLKNLQSRINIVKQIGITASLDKIR